MNTSMPVCPKARRTDRSHRRHHYDHPKGRSQPLVGRPLDQHPVWPPLREALLTVTPADFDQLPGRVDEIVRWGHALMYAPQWQNARQGRKALRGFADQLAVAIRFASDVAADSEEDALNVVHHVGLSLPGFPQQTPIVLCKRDEEYW